jgi:tetratricopeptide (TPR) repeat protein
LEFCYEQIPYQQFHQGLEALEDADVETAAAWLNKAAETANPSLMFEIESHKKDLAMVLVDSVALNKSEMTFTQAELIINKALLISPNYPMGIEALANLYIEKGNVLYEQKNFARATSYYQRALKVDPDSRAEVQNKYNDLAESLMDEANTFSANDDYIMAIEALKSLIDIDPSRELDLSPQIEKMKSLLAVEEEKKTQDKISEIVAVRRKKMIPKESIMVLLGMTPYQVENVLGKPDHQDTMENAGTTYEMWTYTKNAKAKRLYFENKLLVKIDR